MKKSFLFIILTLILVLVGCSSNKGSDKPYEVSLKGNYENAKEIDAYKLKYDEKIIKAYEEKIDELEKKRREEIYMKAESDKNFDYSSVKNLRYELILLNDDNIPELVAGEEDSWLNIYTYVDGKVVSTGNNNEKQFVIGENGSQRIEYIPKAGIVYTIRSDYAGMINYYDFKVLNENNKFDKMYSKDLYELHFDDINGNKIPDDGEQYSEDIHKYFFGDKEINKDEYMSYRLANTINDELYVSMLKDSVKEALQELVK